MMAELETIVSVNRSRSGSLIIVVDLRNETLELGNVAFRELAVPAEMSSQRRYTPRKQTIQDRKSVV